MTTPEFQALPALQDHRVRMIFKDGHEVIATLLFATIDLDDSRHIIYDNVERSTDPHLHPDGGVWHAEGEYLVSCSAHDPQPNN